MYVPPCVARKGRKVKHDQRSRRDQGYIVKFRWLKADQCTLKFEVTLGMGL